MRLIDADALIADLEHDVAIDQDTLDYEDLTEINRANIQFDKDCKKNAIDLLKNAPTIEPEQRWIPCSERLPEHRLYVLVTYKYEYGLIDNGITWYSETENKWNTSREVIAWMPLPEPYKGETE